ncbi:ATP synthase F0 subunit B [Thalassoglobus sp. JC818]|uniref:ATP synthase F0 subunit B n=1 Tax=Thalassoglobus sp. JC818 TaxID=3232136 RepID=UPI00345881DD
MCLTLCLGVGAPIGFAADSPDPGEDHASSGHSTEHASSGAEEDPITSLLFPKEPNYNLPPVQPKLDIFLWTLVVFGGFIFIMRAVAWNPLIKGLNAREGRVVNAEREAKAALLEVERLRTESEARLAQVQEQVKSVIASARSEAETQKQEILAQAEQESKRIREEALRAIREAQESALQTLDERVDEQVGLATEHVVGRRL